MKAKSIYIGDTKTQEKMLKNIHARMSMAIQAKAMASGNHLMQPTREPFNLNRSIKLMKNRARKHFGLQNKYSRYTGKSCA